MFHEKKEKGVEGGEMGAFIGAASLRMGLGFARGEAMDGQRASGSSGSPARGRRGP
jgi:hypothetical protein